MKLSQLLLTTLIGTMSLSSQANANNLQTYKPATNPLPISQPKKPEKPKQNHYNLKAILEREDEVLGESKIKYKIPKK